MPEDDDGYPDEYDLDEFEGTELDETWRVARERMERTERPPWMYPIEEVPL